MGETLANASLQNEIEGVIRGIFDAFQNHDPAGIEAGMHPAATVWDVFVPRLFRGAAERAEFLGLGRGQDECRRPGNQSRLEKGDFVLDVARPE